MTRRRLPPFQDMAGKPESVRIDVITAHVRAGQRVAFYVEDDAKADRYLEKLVKKMPKLFVHYRGVGLTPDTIMLTISLSAGMN